MTTTIFAVIVAVSNAIVALFSFLLAKHNTKHDKEAKKEEKKKEAEKQLKDACNNGNMSQLIDAAKQVGKAKR